MRSYPTPIRHDLHAPQQVVHPVRVRVREYARGRLRILAALVLLLAAVRPGSGDVCAQDVRTIEIKTNYSDAVVYADSIRLGSVSQSHFHVPSAASTIRLVSPHIDNWSLAPLETTLPPGRTDTLELVLNFPYYYSIESLPFDANVFLETNREKIRIGETPMLYRSARPLEGALLVEKAGYRARRIEPGESVWNTYDVTLESLELPRGIAEHRVWTPPRKSRRWIEYVAGGTALVAGVVAVHYKSKADRRYEEYERTGDPTLRPTIERYDLYSGVSLGVMQVGLGVLALRLVLR